MTEEIAKVTAFPKERIVRVPIPETMREQQIKNHQMFLNGLINEESNNILMSLMMAGVNVSNPDFIRNYSLTIQMMHAAVYKAVGMDHPLQEAMNSFLKKLAALVPPEDQTINIQEFLDNEEET